jgi:hypothetical protein
MSAIITAYRTMELTERQEARIHQTLRSFGVGSPMFVEIDGDTVKPVALGSDPELESPYHSFFMWTENDTYRHEIEIEWNGDAAKIPELITALRFCGFAAGRSAQ